MALDPRILLQAGQGVPQLDLMTSLQQGLQARQAIQQAPLLQKLQEAKLAQAQQDLAMAPLEEALLRAQTQAQTAKASQVPEDKNLLEIRKEVRSSVGKGVTSLGKAASTLKTNFQKLQNLTGQIDKGSRSAVSQALVSLVKLGDPGSVVRESEMEAALNRANPIAAITNMLSGKGVGADVIESVTSRIDPLDPTSINTAELLDTARSLVSANVPSIQSDFESQRERALLNLSEPGFGSIFTPKVEQSISGLSELVSPGVSAAPAESGRKPSIPPGLPEGTTDNGDGTFTLPDGTVIRRKNG